MDIDASWKVARSNCEFLSGLAGAPQGDMRGLHRLLHHGDKLLTQLIESTSLRKVALKAAVILAASYCGDRSDGR